MNRNQQRSGFTLVQLTLVVGAATGILAAAVGPEVIERNEAAAIQTLRRIAAAQSLLQASGTIDTDGDGIGEFGYFGELSGVDPVRVNHGMGVPAIGMFPGDLAMPRVLPLPFGSVQPDSLGEGTHWRQGYVFKIYLPDSGALARGIGERAFGGSDPSDFPSSDNAEALWCAYAFPVRVGRTGQRVFCVNQTGQITFKKNDDLPSAFAGYGSSPHYSSAFTASSMASPLADGQRGMDMNIWKRVR